MTDLRTTIRKTRKIVGLTQAELAEKARVSSLARYAAYEIGYAKLKSEELDRILKVLNRAQKKRLVPLSSLATAMPTSPDARRGYRIDAGLTQQELASRMGVFQDLISRFELGKKNLNPEQARRWVEAIKAAKDEVETARFVKLANDCLAGTPVDSAEITELREQVARLTLENEKLRQQVKNLESISMCDGEVNALQHYTIEQLKERFGKEAVELVNQLT